MTLRLVPLDADNVEAACRLELRPGQEHAVEPVAWSIAEAYVHGPVAWPRLVVDDERAGGDDVGVVGFVMAFLDIAWDPETRPDLRRSGIWRLNVAADAQGRGVGSFAVREVVAEVERRRLGDVFTTWEPGPHGPEGFWLRQGFTVLADEDADGQRVGTLRRPGPS